MPGTVIGTSLLKAVEVISETMRAEVIGGEIIINAMTPPLRHALAIRGLREALGSAEGLIPLERTSVILPVTEEVFIPDLAYYSFEDLDPDVWLVPANALVMAVEVLSGKDNGPAARRDRKDKAYSYAASGVPLYLLVDQARKTVVLHSKPAYNTDAKRDRYSAVVQVPYGDLLQLPEPFNRTPDTSIFKS
jgi:Uma2 family endonuclease